MGTAAGLMVTGAIHPCRVVLHWVPLAWSLRSRESPRAGGFCGRATEAVNVHQCAAGRGAPGPSRPASPSCPPWPGEPRGQRYQSPRDGRAVSCCSSIESSSSPWCPPVSLPVPWKKSDSLWLRRDDYESTLMMNFLNVQNRVHGTVGPLTRPCPWASL